MVRTVTELLCISPATCVKFFFNKSTCRVQTSAKASRLHPEYGYGRLQRPDPSPHVKFASRFRIRLTIPKLNGTSLSKYTCVVKFSSRSDQFFQSYKTTCGIMPHRTIWKNIKEINPNPEADDLRNLITYIDRPIHVYSRYRAFYSRRTKSRCH